VALAAAPLPLPALGALLQLASKAGSVSVPPPPLLAVVPSTRMLANLGPAAKPVVVKVLARVVV
jgi:hypothetical protein